MWILGQEFDSPRGPILIYQDPLMDYVPVVSAMIIVHMQAEQVSQAVIDQYVEQTKYWINQLTLDIQSRGMHELLREKQKRH